MLDVACGEGYGAAAIGKAGAVKRGRRRRLGRGLRASPAQVRTRRRVGDAQAGSRYRIGRSTSSSRSRRSSTSRTRRPSSASASGCSYPTGGWSSRPRTGRSTPARARGNPFHRVEFDDAEFARAPRRAVPVGPALHAVPAVGRVVEPPVALGRAVALAPDQGLLAGSSWLCPKHPQQPRPVRPGGDRPGDPRTRSPRLRLDPTSLPRPRSRWSGVRPYILVAVNEGVRPS